MPPSTLVLFDIDGTLVDCGKAAGKAFSAAFHEAFGVPCPIFKAEEVSGLTDTAILMEVVRRLKIDPDDLEQRRDRAFEIYARNLERELKANPAIALPGASRAVERIRSIEDCAVGLLTGSTEATARVKLETAGISFEQFVCGAYSEDGELREALPPAARRRFAELFGDEPRTTILIGDTPRDVQAAHATGCEFIGVATGPYSVETLEAAGARIVLRDLKVAEYLWRVVAPLCSKQQ
ncbi:MAG TPA: HAD family hydrolase [Candidatus Binatia bacterium]|jgi:phosphoglycolate phosphatase-like HAD superfamily hydrolase